MIECASSGKVWEVTTQLPVQTKEPLGKLWQQPPGSLQKSEI